MGSFRTFAIFLFLVVSVIAYDETNQTITYTLLLPHLGTCNITLLLNISPDIKGTLFLWPIGYNQKSPSQWIAYVNCDDIDNIKTAQGNFTNAIILNTNNKNCSTLIDKRLITVPVFRENNAECRNIVKNNITVVITPLNKENTTDNNSQSSNNNKDNNLIQTYQTAMIVLYAISGLVLGMFFIIILANVIKNRLNSLPFAGDSGDNDLNSQNKKPGIAKNILESFHVYQFSLQNNAEAGSGVGEDKDLEKEKEKSKQDFESMPIDEKKMIVDMEAIEDNSSSDDIVLDIKKYPLIKQVLQSHNHSEPGCFPSSVSSNITDEQLTCPICLGDFESGDELRVLPCYHQYHINCIDPWLLDISPLCPMCKADYTSWDIDVMATFKESALSSEYNGNLSEEQHNVALQSEADINLSHTFPHFRWVKYLTAIRRAGGRRRHNRRSQSRQSGIGLTRPRQQNVVNDSIGDSASV